MKTSKL